MSSKLNKLKAPFPAFGGKSRIADVVWSRLGDVRNYIEPFCFSAAVLLKREEPGPIETINDLNHFVANFWRAVKHDPEAVALHADHPVIETDLHARHRWLVASHEAKAKLQQVRENPDYFDAKIAGWWCWGACMWIGSGWCDVESRNSKSKTRPDLDGQMVTALHEKRPMVSSDGSSHGKGVHAAAVSEKLPFIGDRTKFGRGVQAFRESEQIPMLSGDGSSGREVHAPSADLWNGRGSALNHARGIQVDHRPQLADAFSRGRGVNGNDHESTCLNRRHWLVDWMMRLADRLRPVRVCCGHWARVCDSESTLTRLGLTGVLLDPPYRKRLKDGTKNRSSHIYANDKSQDINALCDEVQAWCLKWGSDPLIRIALCGLEGEYPELDAAGWEKFAWKSNGGYGNRSDRGKENAARERIWLNRSCLQSEATLFTGGRA